MLLMESDINYNIIKKILEQMVESGELSFGWSGVKEFILLNYVSVKNLSFQSGTDSNISQDDIMCRCEYIENDAVYRKTVLVPRSKLRDDKLDKLGI